MTSRSYSIAVKSLPLMFLSEVLEERRSPARLAAVPAKGGTSDRLQGIVYSSEGKRVGLVIERISILSMSPFKSSRRRAGLACSSPR